MKFRSRDVFAAVLIGAIVGAMITDSLLRVHPDVIAYVIGPAGLLPLAVSTMTALLLFIGARHAASVLQHNARAEMATRFQKAAEMTASNTPALKIAGLALLREIFDEDARRYGVAALETIVESVEERAKPASETISGELSRDQGTFTTVPSPSSSFGASGIITLNRMFPDSKWPEASSIVIETQLQIGDLHIAGMTITNEAFRNMFIARFMTAHTSFERCTFKSSRMNIYIGDHVAFVGCDFTQSDIRIAARSVADGTALPTFRDCTGMETATVNGMPMSKWLMNHDRR